MNLEALLNIVKCKPKSALPDMLKSHKLTFSFFDFWKAERQYAEELRLNYQWINWLDEFFCPVQSAAYEHEWSSL